MFEPTVNEDLYPSLHEMDEGFTLQKLSHRHHAIMDYMLAHPVKRQPEVAAYFKVTPAWLSTVRNSDLFKARFAERRRLMDEDQSTRIASRLADVAEDGIEALSDIIADEEQDGRLKLDATKMALESLGFLGKGKVHGEPQQAAPAIQVNVGLSVFEKAREKAIQGSRALAAPEPAEDDTHD